jgi:biofilm PGA synthesis lipoprotein PgaB
MKLLRNGIFLILVIAMSFLAAASPSSAASRIRAAQVSYLPSRNYPQVAAEFARMRRMGLDTVILRVFQRPGDRVYPFVEARASSGVYFATDAAPVVADVLGSLTALAHAAGLKVFAWMTTLSTPLAENGAWHGRRYDPGSGSIMPCKALDPFRSEVRQRLLDLFRDLARYDIDGVLLQDDLVLRQTEGFSSAALAACLRDTGRLFSPRELFCKVRRGEDGRVYVSQLGESFQEWAAWKNRYLLKLAADFRNVARRVRPDLPFAVNLPYEVLTAPDHGLAWFSQDFDRAVEADFEYIAIMAYHRQMSAELSLPVEQAIAKVGEMAVSGVRCTRDPARLLLKLQTRDFVSTRDVAHGELRDILCAVKGAGDLSLAFFPYHAALGAMTANRVAWRARSSGNPARAGLLE